MSVATIPEQPQIMRITPDLANDWLDNRNLSSSRPVNNRTMSKHIVRKYAEAMAEGRWMRTHQGIAFDSDGWLIDGQHRLAAIIEVGMPVEMMVVPNCAPETFAVLDTGFRRQAAHLIPVGGPTIAAAARALGTVTGAWNLRNVVSGVFDNAATNDQILGVYENWRQELDELAPLVSRCYTRTRINKGFHLAVLAQAARTDYADGIDNWLDGLNTGENLASDDPRLHLRNRFLREFRVLNSSAGRGTAYRLIVRAWNAHAGGKPVQLLRAREDLPPPEVRP